MVREWEREIHKYRKNYLLKLTLPGVKTEAWAVKIFRVKQSIFINSQQTSPDTYAHHVKKCNTSRCCWSLWSYNVFSKRKKLVINIHSTFGSRPRSIIHQNIAYISNNECSLVEKLLLILRSPFSHTLLAECTIAALVNCCAIVELMI
jgi:hypothetical protein